MFFDNFGEFLSLLSRSTQWSFGPDIKLAINFVAKEKLMLSYAVALTVNFLGALSLYYAFPLASFLSQVFLYTTTRILPVARAALVAYLFWWVQANLKLIRLKVERKLKRITVNPKSNKEEAVSNFIKRSHSSAFTILFLNFAFPIPFLGTALTGGTFAFSRSYWSLFLVAIAKFAKVTAIAAVCFMYQPLAGAFSYAYNSFQPISIAWAPIWSYSVTALFTIYAELLLLAITYFALFTKQRFRLN